MIPETQDLSQGPALVTGLPIISLRGSIPSQLEAVVNYMADLSGALLVFSGRDDSLMRESQIYSQSGYPWNSLPDQVAVASQASQDVGTCGNSEICAVTKQAFFVCVCTPEPNRQFHCLINNFSDACRDEARNGQSIFELRAEIRPLDGTEQRERKSDIKKWRERKQTTFSSC